MQKETLVELDLIIDVLGTLRVLDREIEEGVMSPNDIRQDIHYLVSLLKPLLK